MDKTLFLMKGHIKDLSDVLRIARTEGRKVLNCEKVNVKPVVYPFQDGYLVVVSPEHDGCSKASDVGSREQKNCEP